MANFNELIDLDLLEEYGKKTTVPLVGAVANLSQSLQVMEEELEGQGNSLGSVYSGILNASNWDLNTKQQTITFTDYDASANGLIGVPSNASAAQKEIFFNNGISVVSKSGSSVTFQAKTIPDIDIPIRIYCGTNFGIGGIPSGGTTGQVLVKNSNDNGDARWEDPNEDSSLTANIISNIAVGAIAKGITLSRNTTFTDFVKKLLIAEIAPEISLSLSDVPYNGGSSSGSGTDPSTGGGNESGNTDPSTGGGNTSGGNEGGNTDPSTGGNEGGNTSGSSAALSTTLPTESGQVKFMTLSQLYECLDGSSNNNNNYSREDPTPGFNSSTYYIYAVNDTDGTNDSLLKSTLENLSAVGTTWYSQLNKPTTNDPMDGTLIKNHWDNAGNGTHRLFGGPLGSVNNSENGYGFRWYYYGTNTAKSYDGYYWNTTRITGDVVVAIVHK